MRGLTTQMVFLVGGKGTRLGAMSADLPKPLQPVAGKPFLRHLIDYARRAGMQRFLLLAGHLGEKVEAEFADDADVSVLIEPEPLGTGGALRFAQAQLDETFLMANGDSFFRVDLHALATPPSLPHWVGKLALRRIENADRYGVVEIEGERITGFRERGAGGAGVINGGVYLLRRELAYQISPGFTSLERDVFPSYAAQGRLAGAICEGPFIDIGIPETLATAQRDFLDMLNG